MYTQASWQNSYIACMRGLCPVDTRLACLGATQQWLCSAVSLAKTLIPETNGLTDW